MKAASSPPDAVRSVIIGTAGHIDHGKTALVRALTGTDTDRLPEEKKRGITIDLGFAAMRLSGATGAQFEVSLIDVPGHHAFIRNMLAGAGGIEAVMLVIAADEGVMAQTREHLDICSLLGIERGLVVLSKSDAVDAGRRESTLGEVRSWLRSTFLRDATVVPVSVVTGQGIEALRCELARLAGRIPAPGQEFVPRLPPDRSFAMRGFGTVVTGTLQCGAVEAGSMMSLLPGDTRVRVRGIQVHGSAVSRASAPCRVALNLSGVEHREVWRGQMLVPEHTLSATQTLDAEIHLLPHVRPLRHRASVRLHAFAGDVAATVLLYRAETTPAGGTGLVRLQLETPQVLVPGDRFVLRQPSLPATIGGGRVLEIAAPRGQRKADALAWLLQIRAADVEQQLTLRIGRRGTAGISMRDLVRETGLTADAVHRFVGALVRRGEVIAAREAECPYLSAQAIAQAEAALLRAVAAAKNHTLARAELHSRSGLGECVFAFVVQRLIAAGKLSGAEVLSLPESSGTPEVEAKRMAVVEREYRLAGVAPPLLREVAERLKLTEKQMRATVTLLLRTRRLLRLGSDDLFIHCEAVAGLSEKLRAFRGEQFDVARFKSFTGLTRKHAIPLLELLDRTHITRTQPGTAGVRVVV